MLDALAGSFSNRSTFISLHLSSGEFPSQLSPARYLCRFALGLLSFFLNRRAWLDAFALGPLAFLVACLAHGVFLDAQMTLDGVGTHFFACVFNIF